MNADRALHLSLIGAIVTVALVILPLIIPESRLWGVDSVKYLPGIWKYVYIGAWILVVVLGYSNISPKTIHSPLLLSVEEQLKKRMTLVVVLAGLVSMVVFYLLRSRVHFLGDGYTLLSLYSSDSALYTRASKWTEVGSSLLLRWLAWIQGRYSKSTAETAFQLLSVISGGIVFWSCAYMAKTLFKAFSTRFLFTLSLWITPAILLFLGYVEYYPLFWAALFGFMAMAVRTLNSDSSILPALAMIGVAMFLHLGAVFWGLGVVYLIFVRLSVSVRVDVARRIRVVVISVLVLASTLIVYFVSRSFVVRNAILLPFFHGRQEDPNYAVFTIKHLMDIANLQLLLLPSVLIITPLFVAAPKKLKEKTNMFLLLCGLGGLIFLFMIDPRLGMARDWDLMSFTLAPLIALFLKVTIPFAIKSGKKVAFLIVLANMIGAVTYSYVNTGPTFADRRFADLLTMDWEKSWSGWYIWRGYHRSLGEFEIGDIATKKMHGLFPAYEYADRAYKLIAKGKPDSAYGLVTRVMNIDSMTVEANLLSAVYWGDVGERERAEKYFTRVYELQPLTLYYYIHKFNFYLKSGEDARALETSRSGIELYPNNRELRRLHGLLLAQTGSLKQAKAQADTLIAIDATYYGAYQILTYVSVAHGDEALARKRLKRFLQFCNGCKASEEMKSEFGYLLESG